MNEWMLLQQVKVTNRGNNKTQGNGNIAIFEGSCSVWEHVVNHLWWCYSVNVAIEKASTILILVHILYPNGDSFLNMKTISVKLLTLHRPTLVCLIQWYMYQYFICSSLFRGHTSKVYYIMWIKNPLCVTGITESSVCFRDTNLYRRVPEP